MVRWSDSLPVAARPADRPADTAFERFLLAATLLGPTPPHGRALQLGLASVDETRNLLARFDEVVGIDPDNLAVQRARRAAGTLAQPGFFVGDGIDGIDGPFDLILCDYHRVAAGADSLRRLEAILRLLTPRGLALFSERGRRRCGALGAAVRSPSCGVTRCAPRHSRAPG